MSAKKWLKSSAVLLTMVVLLTISSSLDAMANSGVEKQPMEKRNAIEVELHDNYFNPKVITLPQGSPTTLVLKNKGQREHTFTVKKLGIDVEIQPGKTKTITVQPKQPGTYKLICRYHYRVGMVGKVVVR